MLFTVETLTRDSYTVVADTDKEPFVTQLGFGIVSLPQQPIRMANKDMVELHIGTSAPDLPANLDEPARDSVVLYWPFYPIITNIRLVDENVYARWLGQHDYDDPEDLYVLVNDYY